MTEEAGVWLYAVAGRIGPQWLSDASGVGGQPVRTVEAGGLTAAVTTVSLSEFGEEPLRRNLEDLPWLETVARVHHHVIAVIARRTPVIPMRLGTVYRHESGVEALLAKGHEGFAGALERVTAKTEWGVKVYLAQPQAPDAPRQAAAAGPRGRPGAAGSGTAYLLRRRQQLSAEQDMRRTAAASAETIHEALTSLASAAQLRAPQGAQLSGRSDQMILNAAYLVPDERVSDFILAADSLAARHPAVVVERTGPWPPYSFAAVEHA